MAALAQPNIANFPDTKEMDALVDELFDLTQSQLAQMNPVERATAVKEIDEIAARVPEHA